MNKPRNKRQTPGHANDTGSYSNPIIPPTKPTRQPPKRLGRVAHIAEIMSLLLERYDHRANRKRGQQ